MSVFVSLGRSSVGGGEFGLMFSFVGELKKELVYEDLCLGDAVWINYSYLRCIRDYFFG